MVGRSEFELRDLAAASDQDREGHPSRGSGSSLRLRAVLRHENIRRSIEKEAGIALLGQGIIEEGAKIAAAET